MRRVAPTVPIPPAIFRHFAAITVVATVCLALFASGENKQAAAAEKNVAAPAGEEGGGMMSSMLGAEEAALKKSREGGRKEVNGLVIGKSTRLENNAADPDEGGSSGGGEGGGGGSGHIDNYYGVTPGSIGMGGNPGPGSRATNPATAALRPGVPAPIARDPSGIPIPAAVRSRTGPPVASKDRPPPAPTREQYERMMEEDRMDSRRAAPDEAID